MDEIYLAKTFSGIVHNVATDVPAVGVAMVSLTGFSHIVSLIYAAALSPAGWEEAMDEVHRGLASSTGTGVVHSSVLAFADGDSRSILGTLLPAAEEPYREHYGRIDHVLQELERGPLGAVRTGDELIAPRTATEFYTDWVRPNDIEDGLFVRLTAGATTVSFITAGSKRAASFYTQARINLFQELIPHLQQALRTQHHLTKRTEHAQNFGEVVDRLSRGVAIVTKEMQIIDSNDAASQILAERDGLRVSNGALAAATPSDDRQLRVLTYQALSADGVRRGGTMACQRISGKRDYVLHVMPLDPQTAEVPTRPLAMMLIVDPSREPPTAEGLFRQLYGLTQAEASVAGSVLLGDGVGAISEHLSLSTATVRTHLRAIFAKTGTHRQAELVRLLSTVIP